MGQAVKKIPNQQKPIEKQEFGPIYRSELSCPKT